MEARRRGRKRWTRSAWTWRALPAFLAALAVVLPPAVAGQAIAVSVGGGRTGFGELDAPYTLGVELRSMELGGLTLRGGVRRARQAETRVGTTCDSYWPDAVGCVSEELDSGFTLTSWWAGLGYRVHVTPIFFLDGAVRRLRHRLDGAVRGVDTGRRTSTYVPDDPIVRWGYQLGAGARLPVGLPLSVTLRYAAEPMDFRGCVTDTGTPFCGASTLRALSLGLEASF
jgi:hypothetical protein